MQVIPGHAINGFKKERTDSENDISACFMTLCDISHAKAIKKSTK